jgi:hypothetical protein
MIQRVLTALLNIFQEIEDPIVPRKIGLENNYSF